jgi:hypothetical protein
MIVTAFTSILSVKIVVVDLDRGLFGARDRRSGMDRTGADPPG